MSGRVVTCEACGFVQTFARRQRGTLWLWVEARDGDEYEATRAAAFCSPACVVRFFRSPEEGTLTDAFTADGERKDRGS